MRRCEICDAPYIRGTMVDIGVGFMQVSEDEPSCYCYEDGFTEEEEHCEACGELFTPSDSSAALDDRFCSMECEEEGD